MLDYERSVIDRNLNRAQADEGGNPPKKPRVSQASAAEGGAPGGDNVELHPLPCGAWADPAGLTQLELCEAGDERGLGLRDL